MECGAAAHKLVKTMAGRSVWYPRPKAVAASSIDDELSAILSSLLLLLRLLQPVRAEMVIRAEILVTSEELRRVRRSDACRGGGQLGMAHEGPTRAHQSGSSRHPRRAVLVRLGRDSPRNAATARSALSREKTRRSSPSAEPACPPRKSLSTKPAAQPPVEPAYGEETGESSHDAPRKPVSWRDESELPGSARP